MSDHSENSQQPPEVQPHIAADVSPPPLGYESPRDRIARRPLVNVLDMAVAFIICFGAASFAVFVVSATIEPFQIDRSYRPPPHHLAIAIYASLELATLGLLIWMIRTPRWRTLGRWGALGALLGAGVFLLLGGLCFLQS